MQKLKVVESEIKTLVRPSSRLRNAFNMDKDQREINRLCHDIEDLFLNYYRTKLVRNEHFVDLKASYDLERVSAYVLSIQNRVDAEKVCSVIVCVQADPGGDGKDQVKVVTQSQIEDVNAPSPYLRGDVKLAELLELEAQ